MRNEDSCCTRFYNNVRRVWASPPKKTEAKKPPNRRPTPPITNGHEYHQMAQALGNGYQHDDTQSQRNSPPFDANDRHDQMMQQALLARYKSHTEETVLKHDCSGAKTDQEPSLAGAKSFKHIKVRQEQQCNHDSHTARRLHMLNDQRLPGLDSGELFDPTTFSPDDQFQYSLALTEDKEQARRMIDESWIDRKTLDAIIYAISKED